jgi:restriction endonuclease Mrr
MWLFVVIAFFIVAALAEKFGPWVWLVAIGTPIAVVAIKVKREEAEPCAHGTVGAKRKPSLCARCVEEAEAARQAVRAEEEAQRRRSFKQWQQRVRLPSYLETMDPREFEHLVCLLLSKMGYEVQATPYSGDGGVDGFLRRGGELTLLQCKRVKSKVGEPVLRDLYGTMHAHAAASGLVVTTGSVSRQARRWISNNPIQIIEQQELVSLVHEHISEAAVVPENFSPPLLRGGQRQRRY